MGTTSMKEQLIEMSRVISKLAKIVKEIDLHIAFLKHGHKTQLPQIKNSLTTRGLHLQVMHHMHLSRCRWRGRQ